MFDKPSGDTLLRKNLTGKRLIIKAHITQRDDLVRNQAGSFYGSGNPVAIHD
jgi:hypothetical protein